MRQFGLTELTGEEFLREHGVESPAVSQFLPDSRPVWEPMRIWETSEPPAMLYVWDGLLPQGYPSSLFGDGAAGKSYLAMILATHIAIGRALVGRDVVQGPVLYMDAELDDTEFRRRAYRVARGAGLQRPPEGLYYLRLSESLAKPSALDRCAETIRTLAPVLTIIDSFNVAAYGADPSAAADVTALMRAVSTWGTTLMIDHIPKPAPGANLAQARAFGSVFKFNLVRSSISVVRADGGALTLRHTKSNFAPLAPPTYAALSFEMDSVRLETIASDDERLAGSENHATPSETVLFALAGYGAAGATPAEIAPNGMAEKTVRNYLSKLRKDGLAEAMGAGRWRVPIPDSLD